MKVLTKDLIKEGSKYIKKFRKGKWIEVPEFLDVGKVEAMYEDMDEKGDTSVLIDEFGREIPARS